MPDETYEIHIRDRMVPKKIGDSDRPVGRAVLGSADVPKPFELSESSADSSHVGSPLETVELGKTDRQVFEAVLGQNPHFTQED